eukprot:scaffold373734_cov18-Prasinocladus_malaysianus.AAC.1
MKTSHKVPWWTGRGICTLQQGMTFRYAIRVAMRLLSHSDYSDYPRRATSLSFQNLHVMRCT